MTADTGSEQRRGIGARLRSAREKKGLTILQAAEKLHVDARVLESLEGDNFSALGAAVYVRGHLRRYADLVGEAPQQLQDLYAATAAVPGPDLTRIPRAQPGSDSSPLALPALLVTIALALAGLLWWVLSLPHVRPQATLLAPAAARAPAASAAQSEPTAVLPGATATAPRTQAESPTPVAAPHGPAAAAGRTAPAGGE